MEYQEMKEKALAEYSRWLDNTTKQENFHNKLLKLYGNEDEIIDSFYTDLKFGTSGMRGLLGPGTNRVNGFVIRRATQGVANFMKKSRMLPRVIICFDSRRNSKRMAEETAAVFRGNNIKPFLFSKLAPVSVLSYAIRAYDCSMGIMITASHNPKRYNGYKVFNSMGHQVVGRDLDRIIREIDAIDYFSGIAYRKDAEIEYVGEEVGKAFIKRASSVVPQLDPEILSGLKTVYTPLNGAGRPYVEGVFREMGYRNYSVVESQGEPDEDFTTCPVPNPEKILAFNEGFKTMDAIGADIIIATDPDADRTGAAIYHDGMRTLLTGNQLGILLLDFLCHIRPPKPGQLIMKSAASTPVVEKIAERYGLNVITTSVGFKYIGELIAKLYQKKAEPLFYFGFEESNGYLIDPFICEKDGITTSALIVEMAAIHKAQGKDLIDRLYEIYDEFGIYVDKMRTYFFNGAEEVVRMEKIMEYFRNEVTDHIGNIKVSNKIDYLNQKNFPSTNMIQFDLEEGGRMLIRPSGTESKLKVYTYEKVSSSEIEKEIVKIIERFKY